MHFGTRCFWDSNTDNQASENFTNVSNTSNKNNNNIRSYINSCFHIIYNIVNFMLFKKLLYY